MAARRLFAVEEDSAMSQRTLRRIVTAGALAALLALSLPAQAEAREIGRGGMLQWLKNFWQNGVSVLWPSAPADRQPTTKERPGIDPNGNRIPTPTTMCGAGCEQGPGIDPNG